MKSEQKLNLVRNQPEYTKTLRTGPALGVSAPFTPLT